MTPSKLYLTKRNNGFYYVGTRLHDNRIRWTSTKCTKKSDAVAYLKTPDELTKSKQVLYLTDVFKIYNQYRQVRPSTLRSYQYSLDTFNKMIQEKSIENYTASDVEAFKLTALETLEPNSVNIVYCSMKAIFNLAVQQRLIKESPFRFSKPIKKQNKVPVFLSKVDVNKLLDVTTNTRIRDIFHFATLTGMRRAEIVNLTWDCIDYDRDCIHIKNTDEFTTKSGRERFVPLHSKVTELLHGKAREGKYVFCKAGGYKYELNYISRAFKRAAKKAGLGEGIHLHTLRHTTASHLVNSGVSLYEVSKILGHSSVNTTQIYAHLAPSTLSTAINKIVL